MLLIKSTYEHQTEAEEELLLFQNTFMLSVSRASLYIIAQHHSTALLVLGMSDRYARCTVMVKEAGKQELRQD